MGWHVYLVATAQTTIEFHNNRMNRREAKARGETWVNELDLGPARNWREVFDEHGPMWAVRWALPRLRPHGGSGMTWPTVGSEQRRNAARKLTSGL